MKQIRFQPLGQTYQKLGTLLCQTALSIQATDYTAPTDWERLIQQVKQTYTAFKSHAEKEENILFPILHNFEPALSAILRNDQYERMRYLNDLSDLFSTKQAATDKHKSKLFSHKLLYRFDEFVASVLQQMNEHERMINQVLWRYYSDKELVQMAASFIIIPTATAHKRNTTYANNIIPAAVVNGTYTTRIINKEYKQPCASKELAIAI
jgi:hypothetical protein